MDRIVIEGLRCRARVGVPVAERAKRQRILIDLELAWDLKKAGRLDRVEETLDYAAVTAAVRTVVERGSFRLVEAIAGKVAQLVLDRFGPAQVQVQVRKFSVPGTQSVGVRISRSKRDRTRTRV